MHHNIVSTVGRYEPFVAGLRADGYLVRPYRKTLNSVDLDSVTVLVIGNALHPSNNDDWSLPTPGAFDPTEIQAVHAWVTRGGALLLLVDHMPFPGAASELAGAFGLEFINGYVEDPDTWDPLVFRRSDGTLRSHALTDGIDITHRVDSVGTFDGSAFRLSGAGGQPILLLGSRHVSYHPQKSWDINASTPKRSVDGWLQGAALEVGSGRVVVFADATMFSAQIGPGKDAKLGMNTPQGAGNLQFLRNVLHWLTRYRSGDVGGSS